MKKILTALLFLTLLISLLSLSVFAEAESSVSPTQNPFALFYAKLAEHSDKILAALAFLGSLILAFSYRKGLLPLMRTGLSALSSAVSGLKEETERLSTASSESAVCAISKLEAAENVISSLNARLGILEDELRQINESQSKNGDLKTIMRFQIDMLYEVFMSSSLPAYQKDAVGEKISDMKRLVSASEDMGNE